MDFKFLFWDLLSMWLWEVIYSFRLKQVLPKQSIDDFGIIIIFFSIINVGQQVNRIFV